VVAPLRFGWQTNDNVTVRGISYIFGKALRLIVHLPKFWSSSSIGAPATCVAKTKQQKDNTSILESAAECHLINGGEETLVYAMIRLTVAGIRYLTTDVDDGDGRRRVCDYVILRNLKI
jgi:hypothetical protein